MKTGTGMKRANAVRKAQSAHQDTAFCAVHPDNAAVRNTPRLNDAEAITLGPAQPLHRRVHATSGTVMRARKKK